MDSPTIQRIETSDGRRVYRIGLGVSQFLKGYVYLLLGGECPTLIDAGGRRSVGHVVGAIERLRAEHGEAIRVADIGRILLTHGHTDHVGGCAEFARLTGAEVHIHTLDAPMIREYDETAASTCASFRRFLTAAGVPAPKVEDMVETFGYVPGRIRSVANVLLMEDGDRIDDIDVVHTPGHTPGHACLLAGDTLFAGDHILARTISQLWPESVTPNTGLANYLESLGKIERIEGVARIVAGHEAVIDEPARRIDAIRRNQERRLDRMRTILADSSEPMTTADIVRRMYLTHDPSHALLAFTDIGARLEHLVRSGEFALVSPDDRTSRYRIA